MTTIDAKQFEEICDKVWSDRVAVLRGSGNLSGDATLVRAVFWRLCNAGIMTKGCADTSGSTSALLAYRSEVLQLLKTNSPPGFDGAPILDALLDRYQNETPKVV